MFPDTLRVKMIPHKILPGIEMTISNTLKILITTAAVLTLTGCAVPGQQSTSGSAAVPVVSDTRTAEPAPAAPEIQAEVVAAPEIILPATPAPEQPAPESPAPDDQKSSDPLEIQPAAVDREFLQNRLNEYRSKLDRWVKFSEAGRNGTLTERLPERSIECIRLLEHILSGYSQLLGEETPSRTVPGAIEAAPAPGEIQQLDITFLESRCEEILVPDVETVPVLSPVEAPQYSFEEFQEIINSHINKENYSAAILWYDNLLQKYPDRQPDLVTRMNYGFALQYTGQIEAAAKYFTGMLDSQELGVDPAGLLLETAELNLAGGDIEAAERAYENFILAQKFVGAEKSWAMTQFEFLRRADQESDDMLAYIKLLRDLKTNDYRVHWAALNEKINSFAHEHAGSPAAVNALRLKDFMFEKLQFWFGGQLVKIDKLVAAKKFAEATDIVNRMANYYLPADLQTVVQKTYYEISQAELYENETQQRQNELELSQKWDNAVHLMDSQRFAEAIVAFEMLQGTEYEEKAADKIAEAANLAAGRMRKEAAALFIQAGKTTDVEEKRELLKNSHRLLNEILDKFPQTDLLDKVQQNIDILEEQIRKFDPALLEELRQNNTGDEIPEAESDAPPSNKEGL